MQESDLADLRRQIAYVPQEPYLFQGSIAENIRMGRPDATEKEIREAAMQAHAHDFIMEFRKGMIPRWASGATISPAGRDSGLPLPEQS